MCMYESCRQQTDLGKSHFSGLKVGEFLLIPIKMEGFPPVPMPLSNSGPVF